MFANAQNEALLSESNSSVDWECDVESRSWSSSASWSDDVEGEATSRLRQQLQDIEKVLYGEASPKTLPLHLRLEVAQWRATFPHLRVCGVKPPIGPRTSEEEGQEEVYASHGEGTEEEFQRQNSDLSELREQLKVQVMKKLHTKMRPEILNNLQIKTTRETSASSVSLVHHREPLLTHRQSARKESNRKPLASPEAELGSILRVSPLPRRTPGSRGNVQTVRSNVVLPPIEQQPQRGPASSLSVMGRQTRLVQQKSKMYR
ncbi:uncharacterized protein LOC117651907 [Thrips palmi]|uniref:Uncharacterized protein LOC117651907 n=1 Tax=Thrips palmi TaxID=161013 RepID=A0A6P9A7Q1_THRPL|nr:uncharacterized protein LOC117651907 [Thrips palmi]